MCVKGDSPHSYSCACPEGKFGESCDLEDGSALAFNGNSYVRWRLQSSVERELNLRLSFRTKQEDAVLMDARGESDYSTLEVSGEYV